MPVHEPIEELPERREAKLLRRHAPRQGPKVRADIAGGNPDQVEALPLGPCQEVPHRPGVRLSRVCVGKLALEELVPRKPRRSTRRPDNGRHPRSSGATATTSRQGDIARPLIDDDLALRNPPFFHSLPAFKIALNNALCLSLNRPWQGGYLRGQGAGRPPARYHHPDGTWCQNSWVYPLSVQFFTIKH